MLCLLIGKVDLGIFFLLGRVSFASILPNSGSLKHYFIDMFRICDDLEKGTWGGGGVSFCVICLRAQC